MSKIDKLILEVKFSNCCIVLYILYGHVSTSGTWNSWWAFQPVCTPMSFGQSISIKTTQTCLIVRTPRPFSLVVDTLGGLPMWPQLRRQTIKGVGTPIASHSQVTVCPAWAIRWSTGGLTIVGAAGNKINEVIFFKTIVYWPWHLCIRWAKFFLLI